MTPDLAKRRAWLACSMARHPDWAMPRLPILSRADSDFVAAMRAILDLIGRIGPEQVSAEFVRQELDGIYSAGCFSEILIVCDSGGGDAYEAARIVSLLLDARSAGYKLTMMVVGRVDSVALWISASADEVWVRPNASARVHHITADNPMDREAVQAAKLLDDAANRAYLKRSHLPPRALADLQGADTVLEAEELIRFGLADSIIGLRQLPPEVSS